MKLPVISEGHNAHYDDTVIAFSMVIYRHFSGKIGNNANGSDAGHYDISGYKKPYHKIAIYQ